MMSRDQLKQIAEKAHGSFKYIPRLVENLFPGEHRSSYVGNGMEFERFKEYEPGDDLSKIDPYETSRNGGNVPIIAEHREEREVRMLLVADLSSAMFLRDKPLMVYSASLMLARWAVKSYIPVGLWAITDDYEIRLSPKQARRQIYRIEDTLASILCQEFDYKNNPDAIKRSGDSRLNTGWFKQSLPLGSAIFVFSDFLSDETSGVKSVLSANTSSRSIIPVVIQDELEYTFPYVSSRAVVPLYDVKTGSEVLTWMNKKTSKERRKVHETRFAELCAFLEQEHGTPAHLDVLDFEKISNAIYEVLQIRR